MNKKLKKKMVMTLLGVCLILTACQTEISIGETNKPSSNLKQIEEAIPTVYKGLHIAMESYLVGNVLTVQTHLENKSEVDIPLHYETQRFATLSLTTEEKTIEEVVLPFKKNVLKAKEEIVLEANYTLPEVEKAYTVQTKLHLKNGEEWSYQEEELLAVDLVRNEEKQEFVFLPKEATTYVYENKRNEETTKQEETFQYFGEGVVQSVDKSRGTKIYYLDQKGLYLAYQGTNVRDENFIGQVEYNKQMLLAFPLKVGTTWEQDGVHYEITALDVPLKTPLGKFTDVVEVTSNFGTGMKYYYQKDVGLLQVTVRNGDKWEVTTQLVQQK